MQKITTFLMFDGRAEEAMNFYMSLFSDSKIVSITHNPADEDGKATVNHAVFSLNGQEYRSINNSGHGFTFTPAMSLYVKCETEKEIDDLFAEMGRDGNVFMQLPAYPFSKKSGWVCDRFGVSWQLNMI